MAVERIMTIEGIKQLNRQIEELGSSVLRQVARPAVRKAWTRVNKAAKRNAKSIGDKHSLSKSLAIKVKTYTRSGSVVAVVGPRFNYKSKTTGLPVWPLAHLFEFGVDPHEISAKDSKILSNINNPAGEEIEVFGASVTHPGIEAQPFMRPAYDSEKSPALQVFISETRKGIIRKAKELAAKHNTKPNRRGS